MRDQRLTPRFSEEELSAIRAAAEAARMTVTGFCALAALAVARREPGSLDSGVVGAEELAGLQRELFAARVAVNRVGANLNQAVAQLNTTGEVPVWLEYAANRVARAVEQIDAVAALIHDRLA